VSRNHIFEGQAAALGRGRPGRQIGAALVDCFVLLVEPVALWIYMSSLLWAGGGVVGNWTPLINTIFGGAPWVLLVVMIQIVSMWRKRRTLGQWLLGLHVVRQDGTNPGLLTALVVRSLGWIIPVPLGVWSGMYLWYPMFGEQWHTLELLLSFLTFVFIAYAPCLLGDGRTLGDRIAGTALSPTIRR
jgi:uncharacterized RDD family membrane protein YckC